MTENKLRLLLLLVSLSASQVSRLYLHGIFWEELNILYLLFH